MRALYEQAARAARATISVLLLGETGVGKEVLARAIHAHSPRAGGPFMGLNCAALAESLLESELFGHEKGAFTGAVAARAGLFEAADGGTVFLDEVGELPLATQAKLLRVLEERAVRPRSADARRAPIDVRFVAATNRDIEAEVDAGRFRADLYFRLDGIALAIPPLRERPRRDRARWPSLPRGGLPRARSARAARVSPDGAGAARGATPGRATCASCATSIERAAVLCAGRHDPARAPAARAAEPPRRPRGRAAAAAGPGAAAAPPRGEDLRGEIRSLERSAIIEALERCGGNQSKAAEMLGISRRTLVSRLAEFGLPRPRKIG